MKHLDLKIYGRVQGVMFRQNAKEEAEKLNIGGWIKNLPDGSVHIIAEAEEESLQKFLRWCRVGPPLAHVESLMYHFSPELEEYGAFGVKE